MALIWLSYTIGEDTPLYGGAKGVRVTPDKSMDSGDSCNTSNLYFPAHTGTHVDAPRHFVAHGKSVDQLPPSAFVFNAPKIIDVDVEPGGMIAPKHMPRVGSPEERTDLVIIRTGFGRFRGQDEYWESQPGFSPELAGFLQALYPGVRALGMDTISISSLKHRNAGRAAHREFLGLGMLLFEDMDLHGLTPDLSLDQVIALPLRVENGDGAPCAVMGRVSKINS